MLRAKRRRTQDERSAETRSRLIEAAIAIIAGAGYSAASTTAIARRAGVSRGALQHQFGTRYELLAAVSDQLTQDMVTLADKRQSRAATLDKRVEAIVTLYWRVYSSPTFLAVLNIRFGLTNDSPLRARLSRHYGDIYRGSDGPWLALFADTALSRERLIALRRVTLATLRGLAVARFLGVLQGSPMAQIRSLQDMLVRELSNAG